MSRTLTSRAFSNGLDLQALSPFCRLPLHLCPPPPSSPFCFYRYISRSDLEIFRDRVEREAPVPGSGSWEVICDKKTDDLEYSASRRSLPVRPITGGCGGTKCAGGEGKQST